jgi:RNA polymerase sigma-70 factor (ECF subfamily)
MTQNLAQSIFSVLVHENTGMLMTYLRASVAREAPAEDLFQETMVVAWRRFEEFDRTRPFGPWLRGIARNLILAHYRASKRDMLLCTEDVLEHLDKRVEQIARRPGDTWDEKIAALDDCLDALPGEYREPLELHYRDHHNTHTISGLLSTSREAIKKRLQRARTKLADCLKRKNILTDPEPSA